MANDAGVADQIAELVDMATKLFDDGKTVEAENIFASLHTVTKTNAAVNKHLGVLRAMRGDYAGAIPFLEDATLVQADDALAHNVLSVCQFETGDHEAALASADRAIALRRGFGEAFNSRGNALNRLGRSAEALEAFKAASQALPGDAEIHVNISNALRDLGRQANALKSIDRAIALNPRIAEAHTNRGNLLQDLGEHTRAVRSYDAALKLDPNSVDAHWNRSLCNLLTGNFAEGWAEYEWRWKRSSPETRPRAWPAPLWLGKDDLWGRTIVLHGEQGFGDCLQFIRYAPTIARLGARVVVEAYAPLTELFAGVEGVAQVVTRGEALPAADFHCPLMSLPLALGDTGGAPAGFAPYLAPPAGRTAAWAARLGPAQGLRVGLVCSGSATHGKDKARSLSLAELAGRLAPGPAYHLLQKEVSAADRAVVAARDDLTAWDGEIADFADTAALAQAMDLVISVDTSVAHLAGALGRPTWILVGFDPDWRWRLKTEDSAWYPTARLYRQPARRDWTGALDAVGRDLAKLVAAG
ncbi:MAG: sulfotransferase [Phenylobacterium sp.]|nr:sulfotransferase [Phenylobacterium sp.]